MQLKNLRSLIRESINEYIKEIDEAAEKAANEARISKCEEAIALRQERLARVEENEDLKELADGNKIKEIQNEIKMLERAKKKFEAKKAKMEKASDKKENKEDKVVTDAKEDSASVDEADVMEKMEMTDEGNLNESFLKMQKLAGVITEAQYNEKMSEGFLDRLTAKVKGGTSYVGTGLSNVKKAFTGDKEGIKDPKLAANMSALNVKTKTFSKNLDDMLNDLGKLFPQDKLKDNPEIAKLISVYTQALKKAQAINQQIAAGDSKVKGIQARDEKGRFMEESDTDSQD